MLIALVASIAAPVAIERYRARRDYLTKAVDLLREQLHKLQAASAKYWSAAYDPAASPGHEEELLYLTSDVANLFNLVAPDLVGELDQKGVVALAKLNDAVTGGDFATKGRAADLPRVGMCRLAILDLSRMAVGKRKALLAKRWWF